MDNFDWIDGAVNRIDPGKSTSDKMTNETAGIISHTARLKREIKKREAAAEALSILPQPGESIHFISNAKFDFWTLIKYLIETGGQVEEVYISTWTMNRQIVLEIMEVIDAGLTPAVSVLMGHSVKQRYPAVYAQLITGLSLRNQRFIAFRNHAKVSLIKAGENKYIFEGSANLTANPRLENFILLNDEEIYNFHRGWMEKMLNS